MSDKSSWRTGKIHAVPCPNPQCNRPNDFRDVQEHLFDGISGEAATKSGPRFKCDFCGKEMQVVRCERTIVISVRPV